MVVLAISVPINQTIFVWSSTVTTQQSHGANLSVIIVCMSDLTRILNQIENGDPAAVEQLLPLVYEELRFLARQRLNNEKPGQTLQPTALVHEAFIRLVQNESQASWDSEGHFFAAAAEAMRRILIDIARKKKSVKHGGNHNRVSLAWHEPTGGSVSNVEVCELDQALTKLESIEPRKAKLVNLRFFGGLNQKEAANVLGISTSTADTDWAYAKAWLKVELADGEVPN
ncbi:MAG: RNA polymerase sigma factor (TIGR02999 family) [Mariniblastus sp.]